LGHRVQLIYKTWDKTLDLDNIGTIVIAKEVLHRKNKVVPLDAKGRKCYWTAWKNLDALIISDWVGLEDGLAQYQFLHRILVVPLMSKHIVPLAQEVIQADGAHTSFGKYTLFSVYTLTANANMVPMAFRILFCNKDTQNWLHFWKFVSHVHPLLNRLVVTILTDQDKVPKAAAVVRWVPEAHQFHYTHHHRQNIIAC
jgi:hypothetical protein